MTIRKAIRTSAAVAVLGASALNAYLDRAARVRVREWATLTIEDAGTGGFATLADGIRMHYVVQKPPPGGEAGEPVILVHGLMSSTEEWSKNMAALAASRPVWAVDLIGFGFSERVCEPVYSFKYYARCIAEFMDAQGIERASFVGHSLGGAIALQLAYDYPARVSRLVLLAPGTYISGLLRLVRLAMHVPYLPRSIASRMLCNLYVHRVALRNALGDSRRLDDRMLAERIRASQVKGTLDALLAMAVSPYASDLPEALGEITKPALILWGDQDLVLPLGHGRRLVRELPNASLVILEGAGHVANEEFPEAVNQLIVNFLDKD